jgi:hypothetical protein
MVGLGVVADAVERFGGREPKRQHPRAVELISIPGALALRRCA